MRHLTYRVAGSLDVPRVTELIATSFRSDLSRQGWTTEADLITGPRTTLEEMASAVAHGAGSVLIGEQDGSPVSCCRLEVTGNGRVRLGMLCVHPLHQGEGLGRAMLEYAAHFAFTQLGARTLALLVLDQRVELRAWYERIGFLDTGRRIELKEEVDPSLALVANLEFVVYEIKLNTEGTGYFFGGEMRCGRYRPPE